MTTIITNIHCLVNVRNSSQVLYGEMLADLPVIYNAYLVIEDGTISDYGAMTDLVHVAKSFTETYDASGRFILPSWCDSHTHAVFAGSRQNEFVDKIKGISYADIAAKGGGILSTSNDVNHASESELFNSAWERLTQLSKLGTGAIEIKSGYGLSVEGELKMLRVIKKLKAQSNLSIKATLLAAHTYPQQYKEDHEGYISSILNDMLPVVAHEKLADFIDVFCETGFFSPEEMKIICHAAQAYGLQPKLHVNQLNSIGAIQAGVELQALSLDHLETLTDNDIADLSPHSSKQWKGLCTLLPTPAFFLRMPMQPARKLINAGCAIALASDYNPGSSPSGNMNFVVALSCIQMRMLPEEAINAATINGAFAMNAAGEAGSITRGKKANLILTKPIPSLAYLPYSFGTNLIENVMLQGEWLL